MTREESLKRVSALKSAHILLQLPTSFGKTMNAIELLKKWGCQRVLIMVPKKTIIDTWRDEFSKWGFVTSNKQIDIICYGSVHKYTDKKYDCVVCDEVQHLTERVQEYLACINFQHLLCLSATVNNVIRDRISELVPSYYTYKVTARKAMDDNILPDPKVVLIKLRLDSSKISEVIVKNKGKGIPITIPYSELSKYRYAKYPEIRITCTEVQYYTYLSSLIENKKQLYFRSRRDFIKNQWLHDSGERLKWLARHKNRYVKWLLENTFKNERTLTFCTDIEQTEFLGKNAINSKNDSSSESLRDFNEGKITHITACAMLDEGVNLKDCRICLFANLSASDIKIIQRTGRALRHKDPILIIPYFVGTREEEIVSKMKESYNPTLMQEVTNPKDIKL